MIIAPTITERRATFRRLHDGGFFLLPNAWDPGSAVRLTRAGFRAIASTSAGAAWAAGKNDAAFVLGEPLDEVRVFTAYANSGVAVMDRRIHRPRPTGTEIASPRPAALRE